MVFRVASGIKKIQFKVCLCLWLLLISSTSSIVYATEPFSFVVSSQPANANESYIKQLITKVNKTSSAFFVINGVKAQSESCSDELYIDRKLLFNNINMPVVLSLTANDWAYCTGMLGQSLARERLARIKEIFFEEKESLGVTTMPLHRQSIDERYSNFAENASWTTGDILFATIHMPANNNNFSLAAGRNNEFEDRQIANKKWLESLFRHAKARHYKAVVLFTDGNPYLPIKEENDGFLLIRQTLNTLISSFNKPVLLVYSHQQNNQSQIAWSGKLGLLGVSSQLTKVLCKPLSKKVFYLEKKVVKKRSKKYRIN